MSIKTKLITSFFVIAALIGVLGLIDFMQTYRDAETWAIDEAEEVALSIAHSVSLTKGPADPALFQRPDLLQLYVSNLKKIRHQDLEILDKNKKIIADVLPDDIGATFTEDRGNEVTMTLQDGKVRTFIEKSEDYPDGVRQVVVPVKIEGTIVGALITEYTPTYNKIVNQGKRQARLYALSFLLAFAVAVVLGVLISRNITGRIQQIKEGCLAVIRGDRPSIEVTTCDELGELADHFNTMAASIDEQIKRAEFANRALEAEVSSRKEAENRLQHYAVELKQSNDDILSFAYIVSHDLRAPLVSIKGFSGELDQVLQEAYGIFSANTELFDDKTRKKLEMIFKEDGQEALTFINTSIDRMDWLIKSILELSKVGKREFKHEPVQMEELVKGVLSSLAHQMDEKQVTVTVGSLPEVVCDRVSMEQVVGNLVDNALKYLEPGRPGELSITAEQQRDKTTFHFRDNGRGIADEDMHKVFELFRRAGKQDVPGNGFGLAYVKTLLRRLGGYITCESVLGVGTTFSFTIPATPANRES